MHGLNILREISKASFEIPNKILNPYTTKYDFPDLYFVCDLQYLWIVISLKLIVA